MLDYLIIYYNPDKIKSKQSEDIFFNNSSDCFFINLIYRLPETF
jgi:hypothetical protein